MSYCREFGIFCSSATSLGFCSLTACRRMTQISNGSVMFADLSGKRTSDDFIKLVKEMRETQKRYFKTRNAEVLAESKRLEREVDKKIEEAEKGIPLLEERSE